MIFPVIRTRIRRGLINIQLWSEHDTLISVIVTIFGINSIVSSHIPLSTKKGEPVSYCTEAQVDAKFIKT